MKYGWGKISICEISQAIRSYCMFAMSVPSFYGASIKLHEWRMVRSIFQLTENGITVFEKNNNNNDTKNHWAFQYVCSHVTFSFEVAEHYQQKFVYRHTVCTPFSVCILDDMLPQWVNKRISNGKTIEIHRFSFFPVFFSLAFVFNSCCTSVWSAEVNWCERQKLAY